MSFNNIFFFLRFKLFIFIFTQWYKSILEICENKYDIMKNFKVLLIPVLSLFFLSISNAQNYDVLSEDGSALFYDYLVSELDSMLADRSEAVTAALESEATVLARQQDIRSKFLEILGDFPEKTPLNAEVVSTISTEDGYSIEKLHYQSVPSHHVTANFYIPDGDGPHPAVLFMCGHYPTAKVWVDYQNLCILFAKNGIACMIVDPICQYERYQALDEDGDLLDLGGSGTTEQSRLDQGLVNCGSSITAMQVWDNHRGVDYLYSRTDVVDTSRIGALGHSGGGAQASYQLVYDQRLKVGCVTNYLANEKTMFTVTKPQTASQNLFYEGAMGIDQPDYVELFAPKPYMMIGTDDGLFPLAATQETYQEAKLFYDKLGASDALQLFETEGSVHDYTQIKREATVQWFKHWFLNDNTEVAEEGQTTQEEDALYVTDTKNVMTSFENEVNVTDINSQMAESYSSNRDDFWTNNTKEEALTKIKELINYEALAEAPVYEPTETIDRDYYTIEKAKISYKNHVPVTALLYKAKDATGQLPVIVYVDSRGKETDADENAIIEKAYVDKGYMVLAVDLRGFGETTDKNHFDSKHNNRAHFTGTVSLYLGKTLPGQRVQDIEKVLDVLVSREDVDTEDITVVGIDLASVSVLHAAALDERINKVELRQASETPWYDVIADPSIRDQMTHQVPSALKYYDMEDLVNAISPRTVVYDNTYDSRLSLIRISYGELDKPFSSEIFDYTIVNTSRDYIRIRVTEYNSDADPVVTGTGTFYFTEQDTVIKVVVTTADGSAQTTYNITLRGTVGIDDVSNSPYALEQNYPNPFSDRSVINFKLTRTADVAVDVLSVNGQLIKRIEKRSLSAGKQQIELNASDFGSGIYFYNFYVDKKQVATKRMIVTD